MSRTCGRPSTITWTNPLTVTCSGASHSSTEAVARIREAGGIASLAHPVRVNGDVPTLLPELCEAGLNAIEAYHSDHSAEDVELYLELAARYGLLVTGGSDFHGAVKPGVRLGTGCDGNLHVPREVFERLKAAALASRVRG